jgi:cytochrome c biogenesis protein CcdA
MFAESREVHIAAFIAGFLLVFIGVGKVGAALGHKQLSSIARFALTAGLLLYLAIAHLKDVASFYTEVKESVMGVRKQADDRNAEIKNAIDDASFDEAKK